MMKSKATRSASLLVFLALASLYLSPLRAQDPGARYLIIAHDDYYDALKPLADWKTRKGMKARIALLSETGTDSVSIRNYVINACNTWTVPPEYLLFVGNKYQIPFPRFVHSTAVVSYSDNYYANITGDFHNELLHGRFWVSDTIEAKTVVAKVLAYERDLTLSFDSLWYRKGTTIVNEYEPGQPSSAALYWADARYAHGFMMDHAFAQIDSFSYLRGDSAQDVVNAVNNGRTYILYRGTGFNVWETPFTEIVPTDFTNGCKMPVVLSATCATIEGIGINWTNAGTPDQPKGMVGFYGTTTSLYSAAEMRSALCRGTTASLFSDTGSLGAAAEAGRLQYYSIFNDLIDYHSWSLLGDPEMMIWTGSPKSINVTHETFFIVGACAINVHVERNSSPVQGALVCAMAKLDTTFYRYGYTNPNGDVQFFDTLNIAGDSVHITVTGRNLVPYSNTNPVSYAGGPHVLLTNFRLLDSLGGNGDGMANPAEDIEIPFCLMNWGDSTAYGVYATIEKALPDTFFSLHDTVKYIGNIAALDSIRIYPDGYNVVIDTNAPDGHQIALHLRVSDATGSVWTSNLGFIVHSPLLLLNDHYLSGHVAYTPAGDTGLLYIELLNSGSANAASVTATVTCNDSFITMLDSIAVLGSILPGSIGCNTSDPILMFTDENTPPGHLVNMTVSVCSGVYSTSFTITIYVGQKDYAVWDPDPNHSSGPVIHALLDSLAFHGDYTQDFPYDLLSLYRSLFICTGVYPSNCVIKDTSRAGSEIDFYLQTQGGKVYLEGGDVWYDIMSNHGYDFRPLFGIRPVYNSIGTFTGVTGCTGAFTQNMTFPYAGEATMIDYIDTLAGSQLIFKKTNATYGCGVCANNRTVGVSFEFGGLVDTTQPSTKTALLDSIMGYFGVAPTAVAEWPSVDNAPTFVLACLPNPARNTIEIRYTIRDAGCMPTEMSIGIYDISGRLVKSFDLASSIQYPASAVRWDGTDQMGRAVPQGVYFVSLQTPDIMKTVKTILLR